MVARAEELVGRLRSSGDTSQRLRVLKDVRNQVIGNKHRKKAFIKSDLLITLIELLAKCEPGGDGSLAIQCATVAGSLARAGNESASALRRAGGIECLVRLLDSRDEAVVEAGLRALNFYFEGCAASQEHEAPEGLLKAVSLLAAGNASVAAAAARLLGHCARFPCLRAVLQGAGAADALLPLVEGEQPEAVTAAAVQALLWLLQPPIAWRPVLAERLLQRMRCHAKPEARLACASCLVAAAAGHAEPPAQEARRQCLAELARLTLDGCHPGGTDASPLAVLHCLLECDGGLQGPARDCGLLQALPRHLLRAKGPALEPPSAEVVLLARLGELLHVAALLMADSEAARQLFVEGAGDEGLSAVAALLAAPSAAPDSRLGAASCLLALSRSASYLRQLRAVFARCAPACLHLLSPSQAPAGLPAAAAGLLANLCLSFSPARDAVVSGGGITALAAAAAIESEASPGPAAGAALLALANLARQAPREQRQAVMAALPAGSRLLALAGDAARPLQTRVAAMCLLQNLAADQPRNEVARLLAWMGLEAGSLHRLLPPADQWQAAPAELLESALALVHNLLAAGGEAVLDEAACPSLVAPLAALLDHAEGKVVVAALFVIKSLMFEHGRNVSARMALLHRAGVWPRVERLESDFERLDVGERALSLLTYRLSIGSGA